MVIKVYDDKASLGRAAAERAAVSLRNAIQNSGRARIIAATGASQFEFLDALTAIEWPRVEMFHLDEYIGLPVSHPASFRKYLLERLIHKTESPRNVPEIVHKVSVELTAAPIDIAFVGIGENGHLAFNDPPQISKPRSPTSLLTSISLAAVSR